jgi:hypothetical protein
MTDLNYIYDENRNKKFLLFISEAFIFQPPTNKLKDK